MKIALIGNMNNNNFSIMRYFRDNGVDAHLLLYSNDGINDLSHFSPENDTLDFNKWEPYIHLTKIPNAINSGASFPYSLLFYLRSLLMFILKKQNTYIPYISNKLISDSFKGYDLYISSGITPACFNRINLKLDIFYPYSTGIEYIEGDGTAGVMIKNNLSKIFFNHVKKNQISGIRKSKIIINPDFNITEKVLKKNNINFLNLPIPLLYNNENFNINIKKLNFTFPDLTKSNFILLHHSRLIWNKPDNIELNDWKKISKNNNWLFIEFAKFINLNPDLRPILLVVEYGPDVNETKILIEKLNLSEYVFWLPIMPRYQIMSILKYVTIGVGEFYDLSKIIWGGAGYEVLASGKPLLQSFDFDIDEFSTIYKIPEPPLLKVVKQSDILPHLLKIYTDINYKQLIGKNAKEWFNKYNGIGLAKKWLDLIQ